MTIFSSGNISVMNRKIFTFNKVYYPFTLHSSIILDYVVAVVDTCCIFHFCLTKLINHIFYRFTNLCIQAKEDKLLATTKLMMNTWEMTLSSPLTHSFSMHPFSTPWKHQKNVRFSVFRRVEKGCILGTNGFKY